MSIETATQPQKSLMQLRHERDAYEEEVIWHATVFRDEQEVRSLLEKVVSRPGVDEWDLKTLQDKFAQRGFWGAIDALKKFRELCQKVAHAELATLKELKTHE